MIIQKKGNKWWLVDYKEFNTKEEAEKYRKEITKENWIYKLFWEVAIKTDMVLDSNIDERMILEAIEVLTPREMTVIISRYKDGLTLEETGKVLNITRERVRQIEAKALHRLNARFRKYGNGYEFLEAHKKYQEELKNIYSKMKTIEEDIVEENVDVPIEKLELSVRTYNCLKRYGIDYLEQLKGLGDEELLKIRNLGRKSLQELKEKMKWKS